MAAAVENPNMSVFDMGPNTDMYIKTQALMRACCAGCIDEVRHLISVTVAVRANESSALQCAILHKYWDIARLLIESGAGADDLAFIQAVKSESLDIVKLMVSHGADISAHNYYAYTLSAEFGFIDILKYFIQDLKVDIHFEHDSPLQTAIIFGQYNTVKFLLENGANPQADDNSPLRWAQKFGYKDIVDIINSYIHEPSPPSSSQPSSTYLY